MGSSRNRADELRKRQARARMHIGPYVRTQFLDMILYPHKVCQYMEGMEIGPICGKPSIPNYSYCKKHKRKCYRPIEMSDGIRSFRLAVSSSGQRK